MQFPRMSCQRYLAQVRVYTCAFYSVPCIYHADLRNYRRYCNKNTWVPLCWIFIGLHACFYSCVVSYNIIWLIFFLYASATNIPLGIGSFFGGVVTGVLSVVLFGVCVLGIVKWRRRMKEPAASKEKDGIRFVPSNVCFVLTSNVIILYFRNWHC